MTHGSHLMLNYKISKKNIEKWVLIFDLDFRLTISPIRHIFTIMTLWIQSIVSLSQKQKCGCQNDVFSFTFP